MIPFIGCCEDIHDPEEMGRLRVRVYSYHTENKGILPTEMLHWFTPILNNSAGVSGVGDSPVGYVEGSMLFGYFTSDDMQQGIVIGSIPGMPSEKRTASQGFSDPTNTYPLYLNESDVNRLARGVETELVSQKKNTVTGIPGAFSSDSFDEPTTAFAAKYPFNRVFETASGHVIEYDDTPGAERIAIHHKTGSFDEWGPDGRKVQKTHGDKTEIVLGDSLVYISGDANIVVGQDLGINVIGTYRVKAKKAIFDCDVDIYGVSTSSDHISSNVSGKDHVHSGVRSGLSTTQSPVGKKEGMTPSPASSFSFSDDDTEWTESRIQEGVDAGYYTYEEFETEAVEPSDESRSDTEETNTSGIEQTVSECGIVIDSDNNPVYTTQLSDSFTLADVTTNTAVSQYKLVDQNDLTMQEIACNLKHLCLNVLEPLYAKYSDLIVTSGFRRGTGSSQHYKGQAIDMQFISADNSDYYDIAQWIKENLPYDQLLLEYKSYGTKLPWIHVSLKESGNRYQSLTFWNNSVHSTGLVDLSGE